MDSLNLAHTDPLITRSLPTGFWRWVPQSIVSFDESLRNGAVAMAKNTPKFWGWIEYFTSAPLGIAIGLSAFLLITIFWLGPQQRRRDQPSVMVALRRLIFYAIALGFSDLCASLLKLAVGRLKPHVDFYNPSVIPALSFPSNHAVNFSFIAMLIALRMRPQERQRQKSYLVFLGFLTLFVAASRVFVGQHYPLDVLAGLALGSALAIPVARLADRW